MRLLIVEDELELAGSLQRGLSAEGYAVDVTHDGHTGLQFALTGAYAVIVLDLMLPVLSGYVVCERLRAAGVSTPVLVLTGKDGEYDQTDALDGGADDYLTKPFSYNVLVARLRALQRRSVAQVGDPALLRVGDIEIDVRRHRCRRAQVEVAVTPREFMLLEALARRPGEILSKRELLMHAWPGEVDDVNLVEVRVSVLRRKLDQPFGRHSLQTVRGIGYRLVEDQ